MALRFCRLLSKFNISYLNQFFNATGKLGKSSDIQEEAKMFIYKSSYRLYTKD